MESIQKDDILKDVFFKLKILKLILISSLFKNFIMLVKLERVCLMKKRKTAGLLALFFGWFGVHKFYLNKSGQGFIYLFFFWTLIPGVIALFDSISILNQTDEEFNQKYNNEADNASDKKKTGFLRFIFDLLLDVLVYLLSLWH